MPRAYLLVVTLALVLGLGLSEARANPFTGQPAAPESNALAAERSATGPGQPAKVEGAWGPVAVVGRALLTFQREANRLIATHMRAIRDGDTSLPLLIGAGLAFLYGVVHALGPGHGKLVVVSYFLSLPLARGANWPRSADGAADRRVPRHLGADRGGAGRLGAASGLRRTAG